MALSFEASPVSRGTDAALESGTVFHSPLRRHVPRQCAHRVVSILLPLPLRPLLCLCHNFLRHEELHFGKHLVDHRTDVSGRWRGVIDVGAEQRRMLLSSKLFRCAKHAAPISKELLMLAPCVLAEAACEIACAAARDDDV